MQDADRKEVLSMMEVFYNSPAVFTNGSYEIFVADVDACLNDSPFLEGYVFEENAEVLGQYAISYQKYSQNCSADVKFDSKKSHIMIYIKSYYQNYSGSAERFDEMKDFYNLKNNNTVIRFNTLDGSGSTKTNYAFNIYKRIIDFDLKIARITQKENEIEEENLSTETFTKSTTNDRGGYIFNYNSSSEKPTKTSFGDISLW